MQPTNYQLTLCNALSLFDSYGSKITYLCNPSIFGSNAIIRRSGSTQNEDFTSVKVSSG